MRATVVAETTHPRIKTIKLPMFAFVTTEVAVVPRELVLFKTARPTVTRSVLIRPGSVKTYKVLNVEPPRDGLTVNTYELQPGTYRIDIKDLPVDPELDGSVLRIHTDLNRMKTIDVPITFKK